MSGSSKYDEIVQILCKDEEVQVTVEGGMKRFGASGELRVGDKMFAFCSKGRLIVKLPQTRVKELILAGKGQPCVMGRRTMREWVVVEQEQEADWLPIATEAKQFVLSGSKK